MWIVPVRCCICSFSNNGNTCYINAVLQTMLNQRCFVVDVVKSGLHLAAIGAAGSGSLYLLLYLLIRCKYGVSASSSHNILVRKMQNLTSSDFTSGKQHVLTATMQCQYYCNVIGCSRVAEQSAASAKIRGREGPWRRVLSSRRLL